MTQSDPSDHRAPVKLVKPTILLVDPAAIPPPPLRLGQHGSALWDRVHSAYVIRDVGGQELLYQACAAVDRAESLAERIAADGEIVYSRGVPRCHPAIKQELAARAFVVHTLMKLGINYEAVKSVGHPPARMGWSPYANQKDA